MAAEPELRELQKRFATLIKAHRTEVRKISRQELADELGVTAAAVAMWESGNRIPADHVKIQLIHRLMIDPRDLFAPMPKAAA